jgi:hypothetical protein
VAKKGMGYWDCFDMATYSGVDEASTADVALSATGLSSELLTNF